MTEFKIGDKCRNKAGFMAWEVTAIDRFGYLLLRSKEGLTAHSASEYMVPVPTFFEVGKTYQYRLNTAWRFTCDHVGEADKKYAVGPGSLGVVYVLHFGDFENWEEI